MAKTLAQGRKPGSGRKPGRGKTLREGRKPGSGRKKRDAVSSPEAVQFNNNSNNNSQTHISTNSSSNNLQQIHTAEIKRSAPINIPTPMAGSMPINSSVMNSISANTSMISNNNNMIQNNNNRNADNNTFTSRDMEAVDALRELTYSPQFSPPLNSLPTTLPPIVPSRSFPTINSLMTSPRSAVMPPLTLQSPQQHTPLQQAQNKPVIGMISPPVLPQQSLPSNSFSGLLTSPLPPSSIPVRSGPIRPVGIPNGNTLSPTVNMNQNTNFNNNNGKNYMDNSMSTSLNFITNSQSTSNVMNLGSTVSGMNNNNQDFTNGMVPMNNHNNNTNNNAGNDNSTSSNHNLYIPSSIQMNHMDPSIQRPPQ